MQSDTGRLGRVRLYNVAMGLLHLVQGLAIVLLSNDFSLPVTASFMEGPPGTTGTLRVLFDLPLGPAVAAFLFMSAAAHWIVSLPGAFEWYTRNLGQQRNYARWIEYSFSSTLMIVLIAMITGITDVAALIGLAGANASMILFGLLMEKYEQPGRANWLSFWFGCLAGALPWVAIVIYVWAPGVDVEPPAFVYGIIVSLFVFFNSFAINMALQYRQVGPWRSYLFGERVYVLLSLVAKSLLAWQVFANTLVPS